MAAIHKQLGDLIGDQYQIETTTLHHGEIQIRLERFDESDSRIRDCLRDGTAAGGGRDD